MTNLQQLLRIVNCWMKQFRWIWPSSVQVCSNVVASIISIHNSIRVQHGHYFENECLSKHLCFLVVFLQEKIYCSLYHKWSIRFSWMNSSGKKDGLLLVVTIFTILCCYLKPWQASSTFRFCISLILLSYGLLIAWSTSNTYIPSTVDGCFFLFLILFRLLSANFNIILLHIICNREHIARFLTYCIAQLLTFVDVTEVLLFILSLNLEKIILQITQVIWLKIWKVCDVVFMFEFVTETQGIETNGTWLLIVILVTWNVVFIKLIIRCTFSSTCIKFVFIIANLITSSSPFICVIFSILLRRVNKWFHSNLKARLILLQVHYVEFVLLSFGNISDWKVKPLWVYSGIEVEIDKTVVFKFTNFFNFTKISWLKLGIEEDGRVFDVVTWKNDWILSKVLWRLCFILHLELIVQDFSNFSLLYAMLFGIYDILVFFEQRFRLFSYFQIFIQKLKLTNIWVIVEIMQLLWSYQQGLCGLVWLDQLWNCWWYWWLVDVAYCCWSNVQLDLTVFLVDDYSRWSIYEAFLYI